MKTILAIDEGTTGTTAILMDESLKLLAQAEKDFPQHFPQSGWVEHDLNDIWSAVLETVRNVVRGQDAGKIAAIGITNQRETLCFWDRENGEPLGRAIVWQDRRTALDCERLRKKGLEKTFRKATGLLLDPYFSGTKAAWALRHIPAVKEAARKKTLAFGTIDSFLIFKLTGGAVHVTEPSNASRTLAFHLTQHRFDEKLSRTLGVPVNLWPTVLPSMGEFGRTRGIPGLPDGIPITGVLGDQQSALLGQACIEPGEAKCTYGTGAFLLMNTGKKPIPSRHRLLTTIAWAQATPQGWDVTYALEGSSYIAGAAVQWLRDELGLIQSSAEVEALAASVPDSGGVVFVPALTGMGAPHWNSDARGTLSGLSRGSGKGQIARAVLEGVAFQIADLLKAMEKDLGRRLKSLNVDGGAAANHLLMQFQSDLLNVPLRRPKYLETTSLGAVFAAGLGAGIWKDLAAIRKTWSMDREFKPMMTSRQRKEALQSWEKALERTLL